jgi:membrane protein
MGMLAVQSATVGRDAGVRWSDDACYRLGASLAYAALFSIFPLLLLAVTTIGFVLGDDNTVRQRLLASVAAATSPAVRSLLDETLQNMQSHRTARGVGAVVGTVTLLLGASGVFIELQASLNLIWRVKPPASQGIESAILGTLRARAFSFLVVVIAASTLLALLATSAGLQALGGAADEGSPGKTLLQWTDVGLSFGLLSGLLAAVYRFVPSTPIAWRDVAPGAVLTAVLFTVLKSLLGWYLGHVASYAAYGAVGAVLGLLTWIYVSSLVVFYGAEFSRVYAERFGSLVGNHPATETTKSSKAMPG